VISDYLPIIIQFGLALSVAIGGIVLSLILGKKGRKSKVKDSAYECGKVAVGPAQPRFSVKFYLVAMIFVLFDIEVIFMYPWGVSLSVNLGLIGPQVFWAMFIFVVLLEVGHLYAYKKGVFDWNKA